MSQKRVQLTTLTSTNAPLGPPAAPVASTSTDRRSSFSNCDRRPSSSSSVDGRHSNGHLAKMTLDKASDKLNDRLSDPGGSSGTTSKKDKKEDPAKTFRFKLKLNQPTAETFAEYYFDELVKDTKKRKNKNNNPPGHGVPGKDPFGDEDNDDDVRRLAKQMEEKYGNAYVGKKRRRSAWEDYVDKGQGYDETDPFIDNDEAYDELIPSSLTTKHGGFYVNIGTLEFKPVTLSEEEDDDDEDISNGGADGSKPKVKVRREYPPVLPSKKKGGNHSAKLSAAGTFNEQRKKKKLKMSNTNSALKNQAIEQRQKLAASIKKRMVASGVGSPSGNVPSPAPATPAQSGEPSAQPTTGHGPSTSMTPQTPVVVDLVDDDDEDLAVRPKKRAVIKDDDEDEDKKEEGVDEDVPCRQSVIDVIESVARGPSQLAVDKMTAEKMAAEKMMATERTERVETKPRLISKSEHRQESDHNLIKPPGPASAKQRPASLQVTVGSVGSLQKTPTPMSTNEGMVSRLMSTLPNSPTTEQLKALSATLLAHRDPSTLSGHQRQSPSPSVSTGQRSKTPPASLLNPKNVSNYINRQTKPESSSPSGHQNPTQKRMTSTGKSPSNTLLPPPPSPSIVGSNNPLLTKSPATETRIPPAAHSDPNSSLLDQVISTSLRGYGQSSSSPNDLKQPQPAHHQPKVTKSSSQTPHHKLESHGNTIQRTMSAGSGMKTATSAAAPSQNMLDALIQEQFNNLRSPAVPTTDADVTHTKIVKYKDHHRVPNLSKTPPLSTSKASTPPIIPAAVVTSLGHQLIPPQGQFVVKSGSKTTPVMASGIHRPQAQSVPKSRPGPLSKKMAAMVNPPISSAGLFNPNAGQSRPQSVHADMNQPYDLYSKLMMTMGHYGGVGQQQPNVPITINPIIGGHSGAGHSSSQGAVPGHRTTNHSIEALVSPTVSSSSILKPAAKLATAPNLGQPLPSNSLFSSFMNSQQHQQYKK